jgi:hypothetical protein
LALSPLLLIERYSISVMLKRGLLVAQHDPKLLEKAAGLWPTQDPHRGSFVCQRSGEEWEGSGHFCANQDVI